MHDSPPILDSDLCATLDLHGIKLIEASAGTGKTYTIANLYLRYILAGYSPDQILVVTFTKSATEELKGRIRDRLNQARQFFDNPDGSDDLFLQTIVNQSSTPQEDILRLQVAIRSMDEAAIFTIHGFCQKLLLDHALLTRHAYELTIENDDFDSWYQAFFDWWRKSSYGLSKQEFSHLSTSIGNLNGIKADLLIFKEDTDLPLLPQSSSALNQVFDQWQTIRTSIKQFANLWKQQRDTALSQITESKALSIAQTSPYHPANLQDATENSDHYLESDLDQLPGDYLRFITRSSLNTFLKPAYRDKDNGFDCHLFDAAEEILQQQYQYQLALRATAIQQARLFIQQQVDQVKQKNSQLAFQDLLSHCALALKKDVSGNLAQVLLKQFPVAMIDEFQDTDQQQFSIFKTIYQVGDGGDLILIGDPKQSIYAFRGGDIFTYLDARQSLDLALYSLTTNWRSSTALVTAVNHLFSANPNAFDREEIRYQPVSPSPTPSASLKQGDQDNPAVSIWHIPLGEKGKARSKENATHLVCHSVAHQIKALLNQSCRPSTLNGNAVKPSDIAILVRTTREAETLQSILGEYQLPAVFQSRESVFQTREAEDLRILLNAILDHRNQSAARRALASGLFNYSTAELSETLVDEDRWQSWLDHLNRLHQLWSRRGFIQMFQQMLIDLKAANTLLQQDFAHRRLTNLLHLGELLQDQSRRNAGMHSLLNWYQQKLQSDTSEESKIRLESDDALIRIVTIHGSKGLEYPIVFLPFLWSARAAKSRDGELIMCHTSNNQKIADIGSDRWKEHLKLSLIEEDAEQMRILYVALTRARHKIYLAWGNIGNKTTNSSNTALARLIHPGLYDSNPISRIEQGFDSSNDILADLQQLALGSENTIEVTSLPQADNTDPHQSTDDQNAEPIILSQPHRAPRQNWRINSFSGLTRNIHQVAHGGSHQLMGDEILDFQAGSKVGLFLHEVLENIDFSGDIEIQSQQQVPDLARSYGISLDSNPDLISAWISHITQCKLSADGPSLSQISQHQRLNELPFDFTVSNVSITALNQFLQQQQNLAMTALDVSDFSGMITGIIDLVFEYDGKYYLADYKSNQLGHALEDYTPERLNQAIIDRRYDLQSLLYSLALHRYLQSRIRDYDYDSHFGGSYYLFLRAMRQNSHSKYGVHFHRVEQSTMAAFDRLFSGQAVQHKEGTAS